MNVRAPQQQETAIEYEVAYGGKLVVTPSGLDLRVNKRGFGSGLAIVSEKKTSHDTTWSPVYGERSSVRNRFNELILELAKNQEAETRLKVVFRAYNEGIALHYEIPAQQGLQEVTVESELTEFRFPADHLVWATYAAQGIYTNVPLSRVHAGCERPLVIRADEELYAAIAEARLVDYARMKLAPLPGRHPGLVSDLDGPVEARLPLRTPWRVLMLARSPGQLLENNDIIPNLNDPCAIRDTRWIKPGKVLRDVSLSTVGAKACIDLAARQNLQYVLFDAGWYGPETSENSDARLVNVDPARYKAPLDLQEVLRYAKLRGIGVILYVNRRALERQIDELFPLYESWGVKGVKFGFVQVGSQKWTAWLHDAVRKAAQYHLMVDVHDEYRPTGFSRTYPNLITQEGIRGDEEIQENRQALTTLFTRFLAGAADNTICYYDNRVAANASHAYQLAKMICFYSPWQCVYWYDRPDSPVVVAGGSNVIGNELELEFFRDCPTIWDETRVLQGEIGEYAILARRSGNIWHIGCMNAGKPRTFEVHLNFLAPGLPYNADIYSDDPSLETKTRVRVCREIVDRDATLRIDVGAQGGQALRLSPTPRSQAVGRPVIHSSDFSPALNNASLSP